MSASVRSSLPSSLVLVLGLALVGCFGSCPPTDTAEFDAPGLYAALARRQATEIPASSGIELVDGNVTLIERTNATGIARLAGLTSLAVSASEDRYAEETARGFLATILVGDPEPWIQALLANKTDLAGHGQNEIPALAPPGGPGMPGFLYQAEVTDGAWRVEGAFEAVGGMSNATISEPGLARVTREGWTIVLSYPTRSANVDDVRLEVDARGRARAMLERDPPDAHASASAARVDLALETLGLPAAGIPPGAFRQVVC